MSVLGEVIVDVIHQRVAQAFTYRIPEGMALSLGQRVLVPFGRRQEEGVLVGFPADTEVPGEKLKEIIAPLEDYPAILPHLLALARQMAEAVHCPLAETLRLMLPAQMRGGRIQVKHQPVVQTCVEEAAYEDALSRQNRSAKRRMLLTILRDREKHTLESLKLLVKDPLPAIRQLEREGMVAVTLEEVFRRPRVTLDERKAEDPPLTPGQQEVLEELIPALHEGRGRFLLHGVTGSGKTEVFIRLVRETLAMGKTAMILVPEIALTPQMVGWFRLRFGSCAAVLHSKLSAGERFDEWRRIRMGDASVVIGARSAVFAPLEHLGLVVVDEEHETTYLSDRSPRYDAREVAHWRCQREGASLVLASATPSILSFARARRGDYTLLEMNTRVMNRALPEVEIVDMRQELESGNRSIFSRLLARELSQCIQRGEQAILLMNRRGYHSFVSCRSCGKALKCPNCDVSLTYHLSGGDGQLHCHYCGYQTALPGACPACGSPHIRYFGAGTQRVEEEMGKVFPGVGVVRMDLDTTSGKDGHQQLLDQFRSGQKQVLIGTQMVAKGLDFPQVTLVGVIAADLTLNLPDYRAQERTFQLLTQVAGRAGRGEKPGRVVIQTYRPEDPVIQAAARQDYRAFFDMEFGRRRVGLYPPFTIMARLLVESPREEDAHRVGEQLLVQTMDVLSAHPEWKKRTLLVRMDQPPVKVLRGLHRVQVLLKLLANPQGEELAGELSQLALTESENHPEVSVYFEYNPTTMM